MGERRKDVEKRQGRRRIKGAEETQKWITNDIGKRQKNEEWQKRRKEEAKTLKKQAEKPRKKEAEKR